MTATMTKKESPGVIKNEKDRKEEWLNEEIYVEFMNLEEPGIACKFSYGDTRKSQTYTLLHGGKYRLPRRVVQHVESRQTPIWKYRPDGTGMMQKHLESYKSRFQCRQIFE